VQANLVAAWQSPWPSDLPARDTMLAELIKPLIMARSEEDGSIPSAGRGLMASWQHQLAIETTAFAGVAFEAAGAHGPAAQAASTLASLRRPSGGWASTQSTAQAVRALTALVEAPQRAADTILVRLEANGQQLAEAAITPDRDRPVSLDRPLALDSGAVDLRLAFEGQVDGRLDFQLGISYLIDQPQTSPAAPYTIETRLSSNQIHLGESPDLTVEIAKTGQPVAGQVTAVVPLPAGAELDRERLRAGGLTGVSHFLVVDGVLELYFAEPPPRDLSLRVPLRPRVAGVFTTAPASIYPYYDADRTAFASALALKVLPELDLEEAAGAVGLGQTGQATQARPPTPGGVR
jgi:hypothetical protein